MTGSSVVVRVLGPLPPPPHGVAMVTRHVLERLREVDDARVVVHDTGAAPRTLPQRLRAMLTGAVGLLAPTGPRQRVYVAGAAGELLWFQLAVVGLARLLRHRAVFHHHTFSYLHERARVMALLTRVGGPRLEHVVLCPEMGARLQELYPSARTVTVCSNAGLLGPSEPRPASSGAEETLVLGMLSNLTLEKGVATSIETLRRLLDAGVAARLVLAGPCVGEEVERLVLDAVEDLAGHLEWLGPLDPAEVDGFYRGIDLFLLPSTYPTEAEPLVVLDASRHGVPSLVHATGCLRGMVGAGQAIGLDDDFADRATALVVDAAVEDPAEVVERFERRQAAGRDALTSLLARLSGPSSAGRPSAS